MTKNTFMTCVLAAPSMAAFAHDGHGLFGAHWHASDAWGFAVLCVLVAAAWWATRGK
jgi:uncharacterized membrane protein YdcZ (DUF606 family)